MLHPSDGEVGVRVLLNYTSLDDNSRQLRSILTGVGLSHMLSNWNLKEQSQARVRGKPLEVGVNTLQGSLSP